MFSLRQPTELALQKMLERERRATLTYPELGATAKTLPRQGYVVDEPSWEIGRGEALFQRASNHLDSWGIQRSVGFRVFPEEPVHEGGTVLLAISLGPARFIAGCRVIYTVAEQQRHGFAYGTLPSHPEIGEEYFGVTIDNDEVVRFELRAFSRPSYWPARLAKPVTRRLQIAATNKYADSMKALGYD